MGSLSLLSPASLSAASRGADPPSFLGGPHSSISLSAIPEGCFSQVGGVPHVGPYGPDPDGIDALFPSGGSWSCLWAPPHRGLPLPAHGGLPTHSPHGGFLLQLSSWGHPTHTPHRGIPPPAHGGLPTHAPHCLGGGLLFVGVYSQALVRFYSPWWRSAQRAFLHPWWWCVGPSHPFSLSPCAYICGAVSLCIKLDAAFFAT
jgi:hypothetical protein